MFLFGLQACTEMAMPLCQDGVRDMWLPYEVSSFLVVYIASAS